MKFSQFILVEGISHMFHDFDQWTQAAAKLGAVCLVDSVDGRKRVATSDIKKPAVKSFGEWDGKHKEGWVYDLRKVIKGTEIVLSSATKLTEGEDEPEADNAEGDITDIVPYGKNQEVRKLIKKGAMDPEHDWTNALDLVHRAYEVADVERPTPSMRDAWSQYEDIILFAVTMLQKATDKGLRSDSWKSQSLT